MLQLSPQDEELRDYFFLDKSDGYWKGSRKPYAKQKIHRVIVQRTGVDLSNLIVDHKDRNKSNNRRDNLRGCSQVGNQANRAVQKNNSSGYKGVHFHKPTKVWVAQIRHQGRKIRIGQFDTAELAAQAYDNKALELKGEFACTNFPEDTNGNENRRTKKAKGY